MTREYVGQSLLAPVDMSVRNTIAKFDPCKIDDSMVSQKTGQIEYDIKGKNGTYKILFLYPKTWDTEPFKSFEGRKSSQVFFEMRGDEPPHLDTHLEPGFVKRYLPIWHIFVYFTFLPNEGGLVSEELLGEMIDILVQEFRQNLK